jgi:hypothetical protein
VTSYSSDEGPPSLSSGDSSDGSDREGNYWSDDQDWSDGGLVRMQEETRFSDGQWLRVREVLPEWRDRGNLPAGREAALERELRAMPRSLASFGRSTT